MKARILITQHCLRQCEGCCNEYSGIMQPMERISSLDDFDNVTDFLLTGGEPLLNIS